MDDEITTRPFKWQDGLALKDKPNEKGLKGQKDFEKWLKLNESEGPGYTGIYKGEIIGCGGVRIFWEGVGEGWILLPDNIKQITPNRSHRIVKEYLNKIIDERNLQRVQITPQCEWIPGLTYARWLGFEIEGKMRKYLPGNNGELVDCYLMSIIREK